MTVEKMRKDGYPLRIIGNGDYPATLVSCQPLNDGEYVAIYRYAGGCACHSLNDIKNFFKVVEQ